MGLLRRKSRELDLGPANLLPAGDPGCWLVRTTASTGSPAAVRLPVEMPAQEVAADVTVADVVRAPVAAVAFEADPEPVRAPVVADEAPAAVLAPRSARARLAALSANLSV